MEDLSFGSNPLMPGATTPFGRISEPSLLSDRIPPPPPAPYESPRGVPSLAAAAYTPGGTRVPDGTPPVTPGKAVTFGPSVQYATWGATSPGVETVGPPAPPNVLPPSGMVGCTGLGPQRMEEPSKLVYHLPQLMAESGTQDASVAAGDWIARIRRGSHHIVAVRWPMVAKNSPNSVFLLSEVAGR